MPLLSMAWRNVWRNTRRSMVTMAAMAFALWVMVLYSGLMRGYLAGMEDDILEAEIGDIQVHAEGFLDRPNLYDVIEEPDAVVASLREAGLRASARLLAGGLGAHGDASSGVALRGIDVAGEADVLAVGSRVAKGEWLDPVDPKGVVIGRRLSRALGAGVGDELVVLSQGADGGMANDLFLVRGVLLPISDGTDRSAVFMVDQTFRDLMSLPEGAHEILVRRRPDTTLEEAEAETLALTPGLDTRTWKQLLPTVATMLESTTQVLVFVFLIVYLAIGILILNAVLMAVFERIREFGVMKAIGVGPSSVFALILTETAIQTVLAVSVGILLALPAMWYMTNVGIDVGVLGGTSVLGLAMKDIWYGIFGPQQFLMSIGILVVIVFVATLWPALRAARLEPVDAMRHH